MLNSNDEKESVEEYISLEMTSCKTGISEEYIRYLLKKEINIPSVDCSGRITTEGFVFIIKHGVTFGSKICKELLHNISIIGNTVVFKK